MAGERSGRRPAAGDAAAKAANSWLLRVWRGDKTSGRLTDYTVAVNEGEVVLDVLHRLQATQANDLAIRWNCKAGKCGSCSAEVNGRPVLLCTARLSSMPPGPHLPGDP
jgi:succinate dehydrogenase / fumarate reductase, iron-sulfur subunit